MNRLEENDNYSLDNHNRDRSYNKFKVFGKGIVIVEPDAAEVVMGIITENTQLEDAQKENAMALNQVINSIKGIGILPKDIQTQDYNIRPNYDYIEGRQVFRGYEVSNYLKVLIRNINLTGEVIDIAVENGANTISNVNFIVLDQTRYYYEALELAVEDAQNKASIMANKLKVRLNITPIQVNEQSTGPITPLTSMNFKSVSGTTPIEVGQNKITADIQAVFVYD